MRGVVYDFTLLPESLVAVEEKTRRDMKHSDGRVVTISAHAAVGIGRGLLRNILRDAELTRDEFVALLK